jgi:bacillopeptidase F
MNKTFFILIACLISTIFASAQVKISPSLEQALQKNEGQNFISLNIVLTEQTDIQAISNQLNANKATKNERVRTLITELSRTATTSQIEVLTFLYEYQNKHHGQISEIKSFWISNTIHIKARPAVIYELALRKDISMLYLDIPIYEIITPIKEENSSPKDGGNTEPGLLAINAKPLWDLGYTGRNTILLSMDTGVWPDHPAISDNYLGNFFPLNQVWYGVRSPIPRDHASSSHGTHTTGTVLGLDPISNDTIGVAFNATWIASDPVASNDNELLTPSDFMAVFEWVLNPDGNPETTSDVPDVINNSWGYSYDLAIEFGACTMAESQIFEAIEAAGISSPFSAGNEGPGASTTGFPAMLAFSEVNILSVGAINGNNEEWPITDFSSRGPTTCIDEPGSLQIKPEIVAPGYSVRSASGHNDYAYLSGTSMSCPHVSGALLLLREAFPTASAIELKNALYQTAIDLGEPGEDNVYGRGMIDVYAAFQYLSETYTPEPPVNNLFDLQTYIIPPSSSILCNDFATQDIIVRIYNNGTEAFSNMQVIVKLNGDTIFNGIPNGIITAGDSLDIEINAIEGTSGLNEIHAQIELLGGENEYNIFNNSDVAYFNVIGAHEAPYLQDFDTLNAILSNSDWYVNNTDGDDTWSTWEWNSETENNALQFNFLNYLPREGQIDDLWSPEISIPDTGQINLEFVYAYKKRMEHLFKDSLYVLISTDCGVSFDSIIYKNGGEQMATVTGNSSNQLFVPETDQDWDTVNIDLNHWKGNSIIIVLRAINDNGSTLYIDNVNITVEALPDIINSTSQSADMVIYPNPASQHLYVECAQNANIDDEINIFDINGRLVASYQLNQSTNIHQIPINKLQSGTYLLQYKGIKYVLYSKFVINK